MKKFESPVEMQYGVGPAVLIRLDENPDTAPVRVRAGRFLLNDIRFPWETMPNRLFVIGNEHGSVCAVWADHESNAFDGAVDNGFMDSDMVDEEDWAAMSEEEQGDYMLLGNVGEPFQTWYWWIKEVDLSIQATRLLCLLAEGRGAGHDTMSDLV